MDTDTGGLMMLSLGQSELASYRVGGSGLVVGRASYGGVSTVAGPASATVYDVSMKLGTRGRKSCGGATDRLPGWVKELPTLEYQCKYRWLVHAVVVEIELVFPRQCERIVRKEEYKKHRVAGIVVKGHD